MRALSWHPECTSDNGTPIEREREREMLSSRVRPLVFATLTPRLRHKHNQQRPPFSLSCSTTSSSSSMSISTSPASVSMSTTATTNQTIEHIALFNVKDGTEPTKTNTMINSLNALTSLDQVLHLTAGPIHRNRSSSSFKFTHLLHSRYKSQEDLTAYSAHPDHVSAVKSSVLPICEDIMAVDWVATGVPAMAIRAGSAIRVTLVKMKEGAGDAEREEVLGAIGGVKDGFGEILEELSFGENFSPARAKGFGICSIAVVNGLEGLEKLDSKEETARGLKEKVRDLLESVIVVDYVVPHPPSPASL